MMHRERRSPLWAITSYFNPAGYRRRLANYRIFRQHLTVPLVAVELSFSQMFELAAGDADRLVQIRGRDAMFQKERLLNLALGAVPPECEVVAWLDADVILGSDGWAERALDALQEHRVVHLFEDQYNLPPDSGPGDRKGSQQPPTARSVVCKAANSEQNRATLRQGTAWGFAWAARRSLLDAYGLYDACIVGGGDAAIYWAAIGAFESARAAMRMNEPRYQHYLRWGRPFHAAVRDRVGWIQAPLYHLWHGDTLKRQYRTRHEGMMAFEFDPAVDISVTEQGCWRWSSNKPELHAYVEHYFRSRSEDGEMSQTGCLQPGSMAERRSSDAADADAIPRETGEHI